MDTERTIVLFPHTGPGPKKIVLEYYDDHYTPLDVMGAIITWMLDNPGYIQEWTQYVDAGTGDFTGEDAKKHFQLLAQLILAIHGSCDHYDIHVIGAAGQVN